MSGMEGMAPDTIRPSAQPEFWSDSNRAQDVMRRLSQNRATADTWRGLERRAAEAIELLDLAEEEQHAELIAQVDDQRLAKPGREEQFLQWACQGDPAQDGKSEDPHLGGNHLMQWDRARCPGRTPRTHHSG